MYCRFKSAPVANDEDDAMLNAEEPKHGSYGGLLFDKRWRAKRQEILDQDKHQCVVCNNSSELQVHHRQYHYLKALKKFKAPWDYSNKLLITLCDKCHQRGHHKFKVPIIYIS